MCGSADASRGTAPDTLAPSLRSPSRSGAYSPHTSASASPRALNRNLVLKISIDGCGVGWRTMNTGTTGAPEIIASATRPLASPPARRRTARRWPRCAWHSDRTECRPSRRAGASAAPRAPPNACELSYARALADEGHQRVACQKALRMMHQADLKPMHRMARPPATRNCRNARSGSPRPCRDTAACTSSRLEPIVGHAALQAAVEKPAEPNVLGAAPAEIDIRRAQDAPRSASLFSGNAIARFASRFGDAGGRSDGR